MRKFGLLLAVVAGAVMLVAGSAGAAELIFEVQISGKGIQALPPGPLNTEGKHAFKETVYALYIEELLLIEVAVRDGAGWKIGSRHSGVGYSTNRGFLVSLVDQVIENGFLSCSLQGQLKVKDGLVTSARLKSLGASYEKEIPSVTEWGTGGAKIKGKLIDPAALPDAVFDLFFPPI